MPEARLQYVGGIVIRAADPKALAAWYTDRFGLRTVLEHEGGYYGGFQTKDGPFHFGIVKGDSTRVGNAAVTFRVSGFTAYLETLAHQGLNPSQQSSDSEGRFALFKDPEGNEISIWGE